MCWAASGSSLKSWAATRIEAARKIVEQNPGVLTSGDACWEGSFGEALTEIMGGDEERARKIVVEQNPAVLRSGDELGRFGELTEIMGGDEERARKFVDQSPGVLESGDVLGSFGELTEIMGGGSWPTELRLRLLLLRLVAGGGGGIGGGGVHGGWKWCTIWRTGS
jgi:hypothetical protein